MNASIRFLLVACVFSSILPVARAGKETAQSPAARAIAAATANGVPVDQADDIAAALQQSLGPSQDELALREEAVKLSKAQPRHAPGIVAASIALVPQLRIALKVSEAVAKAVRSQAPGIAAAAAEAMPEYAPRIASRVARAVPRCAMRITRQVAYRVPESVEAKWLPWRRALLESAVISAVPLIDSWSVYGAAHRGAAQAERDARKIAAN